MGLVSWFFLVVEYGALIGIEPSERSLRRVFIVLSSGNNELQIKSR